MPTRNYGNHFFNFNLYFPPSNIPTYISTFGMKRLCDFADSPLFKIRTSNIVGGGVLAELSELSGRMNPGQGRYVSSRLRKAGC